MKSNRILHLINILLLLVSFGFGTYFEAYSHIAICFVYVFAIEIMMLLTRNDNGICKFLITLYIQIIGPIDILVVLVSPMSITGVSYYGYLELSANTDLLWQYCFHAIGFYYILMTSYYLMSMVRLKIQRKRETYYIVESTDEININSGNMKIGVNLWVLATLFSIIYYMTRITLNIDVAGKIPVIPLAGVIVYLFRFVKFFLIYRGIETMARSSCFSLSGFLSEVIYIIILNLSDILLDRRAPVFYCLLIFVFFLYVVKSEKTITFVKNHKVITIGSIAAVFVSFSMWSESVRYGETETQLSVLYLLSRLVGLIPGLIGLNYMNNTYNVSPLSITDYLSNTFGSRNSSINKVFTYDILHYSESAVHRSAIPLFIGSRFYENYLGYVMFPLLFGIILSYAQKLIKQNRGVSLEQKDAGINAFVGCYLTVYAVSAIMNGNGEQLIDLFTVPILFIIYRMITHRFLTSAIKL